MYSAGQRARAKSSKAFIVHGAIIVIVGACLSAMGVVSTIYWYNDGFTDTYYFSGAFVCGLPGMALGMMYFCYYAKARQYTENIDKFTDITRGLLRLENHIARFTLVVFALGLYSIPMSIAGIIKHSNVSSRSIHLIFCVCNMLVCLLLFVVGGLSCLKLTSQGMRVKIMEKSLSHEIRVRHNTDRSDSNDTVFTVVDCNINQASVPSTSTEKENSTHF